MRPRTLIAVAGRRTVSAKPGRGPDFRAHFLENARPAKCLCGSDRHVVFKRNDRYGLPINVALCLSCGHVFASRQLNEADLAGFYRTAYRQLYAKGASEAEEIATRVRDSRAGSVMLQVFLGEFGDSCRGRRVAEWGCGGGWNLVPFADFGVSACGFDYDDHYLNLGREMLGLDLKHIQELGEGGSLEADFLILNHVLEHAANPVRLLAGLKKHLRPGGYLYVGLPLIEELGIYRWWRFFHVAHVHYFTIPRFLRVAAEAGYDVEAVGRGKGYFLLRSATTPGRRTPHPNVFPYAARLLARRWAWHGLLKPPLKRLLSSVPLLEACIGQVRAMRRQQRAPSVAEVSRVAERGAAPLAPRGSPRDHDQAEP